MQKINVAGVDNFQNTAGLADSEEETPTYTVTINLTNPEYADSYR